MLKKKYRFLSFLINRLFFIDDPTARKSWMAESSISCQLFIKYNIVVHDAYM